MANAVSGIAVNDDCKDKYLELKRKKAFRYILFKINDTGKEIIVDKLGAPDEIYDQFTGSLPENDCRYAVYDFDYSTEDNLQLSKIFFIAWSPDTARVRTKMLYASSKDRIKRELDVQYELQATDASEVDIEKLKDKAAAFSS